MTVKDNSQCLQEYPVFYPRDQSTKKSLFELLSRILMVFSKKKLVFPDLYWYHPRKTGENLKFGFCPKGYPLLPYFFKRGIPESDKSHLYLTGSMFYSYDIAKRSKQ